MDKGKRPAVAALCALIVLVGCGSASEGEYDGKVINATEAKQALRRLPYRFEFRAVPIPGDADDALAGTAYGAHGTVLHFSLALGASTDPVPMPRIGAAEIESFRGRWYYLDDLQVTNAAGKVVWGPQFRTPKQLREAMAMGSDITRAICEADIGEPCPI